MPSRDRFGTLVLLSTSLVLGCSDGRPSTFALLAAEASLPVSRLYPLGTNQFDECINASPLAIESRGKRFVAVAAGERIAAIDPESGKLAWSVALAAPAAEVAYIVATPVVVNQKLVVAFQRTQKSDHIRLSHHVAVVDLEARALDPAFPELELNATEPSFDGDPVEFTPRYLLSHSALVHADVPDRELGLVYISFGSQGDIRPWHGWVFELDLDHWRDQGNAQALSSVLLTTPETNCGAPGTSNSGEALCGAGVWAPAGPKIYPSDDGYELLIPTGNGVLDPTRGDYSHALIRTTRGLTVDPHCDPDACANFDPLDPSADCLASCNDLFIPRSTPGDGDLGPESGACKGLSLLACYALLDWDLGANAPVKVELANSNPVYVLPGKDGTVFLIDAQHMGTQYDRKRIVQPCGSPGDKCVHDWAGMMVTEPILTSIGSAPVVLLPTFVFDTTHPAGVSALRIEEGPEGPRFALAWQAPAPDDPLAKLLFREHPSQIALQPSGRDNLAWVVSANREGHGALLAIRVRDGAIVAGLDLHGRGQRYVKPLVDGSHVYTVSCEGLHGPSELQGFDNAGAIPL